MELVFITDGTEAFRVYPTSSMLDTAVKVFGENRLVYSSSSFQSTTINLCVSNPLIQRKRRDSIFIGVNGRVIRDQALIQAVVQGYFRMMPAGSYPMAAVDIRLPPSGVDVNIHPAKLEVRFRSTESLFGHIKISVEDALKKFSVNYTAQTPLPSLGFSRAVFSDNKTAYASDNKTAYASGNKTAYASAPVRPAAGVSFPMTDRPERISKTYNPLLPEMTEVQEEQPAVKVLAQLADMYILCETKDGALLIIDQHVAHERVLYEKYRVRQAAIASINLFEPVVIAFSPEETEYLLGKAGDFARFGYFYEIFGSAIKLNAIPVDLLKKDVEREFTGLVQEAMENARSKSEDGTIVSLSCHNAVKAGEELSVWEMEKLVSDLFNTENPYTCPHGRPIVFDMSREELAKKFHR
jgi:DNA mismatch repair protein MutL